MRLQDFLNWCKLERYDVSEGVYEGKSGYFVHCPKFDTTIHCILEAIESNLWSVIKTQLTQGKDVSHMTRVVGYYSKVENWNKSKIGELKDRQKGNYGV